MSTTDARQIHEIAAEIKRDWKPPYLGAVPYIQAMHALDTIEDSYGWDPGRSIVLYFLANASQWKGETAKRVKAELRAILKEAGVDA